MHARIIFMDCVAVFKHGLSNGIKISVPPSTTVLEIQIYDGCRTGCNFASVYDTCKRDITNKYKCIVRAAY